MNLDGEILGAVLKRARGYDARETVEEYSIVDGSLELTKRRVTTKDVPPDMTAVKLILESGNGDELSDEQLALEKQRLLRELARLEKNKKDGERSDKRTQS